MAAYQEGPDTLLSQRVQVHIIQGVRFLGPGSLNIGYLDLLGCY